MKNASVRREPYLSEERKEKDPRRFMGFVELVFFFLPKDILADLLLSFGSSCVIIGHTEKMAQPSLS